MQVPLVNMHESTQGACTPHVQGGVVLEELFSGQQDFGGKCFSNYQD